MENNNTPAVKNTAKHSVKGFIAALNAKRKKIMLSISTMVAMSMVTAISAFADDTASGTGANLNAGDEAFFQVLGFFCTWIGRVGLVIAFVGGTMFGFAIKSEDAESKQRGLTTLAAGFIVFALTRSMNLFFPGVNIPLF